MPCVAATQIVFMGNNDLLRPLGFQVAWLGLNGTLKWMGVLQGFVRWVEFIGKLQPLYLLGLTQNADLAPSPLAGEGWGEGELHQLKHRLMPTSPPSPQSSPIKGEGVKPRFCVSPM